MYLIKDGRVVLSTLVMCGGVGSDMGRNQGGATWNNKAECPVCHKKIALSNQGRLKPHGTRRKTLDIQKPIG